MDRMLPDSFHEMWNGRHWRWLALLAGVVLTALLVGLAALIAGLRDEAISPLAFLFVTVLLLIISMIGSGMFESRATRKTGDDVSSETTEDEQANRSRRDRRTIRSGLVALPAFVAFVAILFS